MYKYLIAILLFFVFVSPVFAVGDFPYIQLDTTSTVYDYDDADQPLYFNFYLSSSVVVEVITINVAMDCTDTGTYPSITLDGTFLSDSVTDNEDIFKNISYTFSPPRTLNSGWHNFKLLVSSCSDKPRFNGVSVNPYSTSTQMTAYTAGGGLPGGIISGLPYFYVLSDEEESLEDLIGDPGDSYVWFYFPQDSYAVSNDDWTDWVVYYHMNQFALDNYETWFLRITYSDFNGNYYLDTDVISTTTSITEWTVERSVDLPDGVVFSVAEIWGVNDCPDLSSYDCAWYGLASSDPISWIASTTGYTLFDNPYLIQPGFLPSTSTLNALFGTTSVNEASVFSDILNPVLSAMKLVFPFNIGANVYDQWLKSENVVLPPAFDFLYVVDESGNITMIYDSEIFQGTTTSIPILGSEAFDDTQSEIDIVASVRDLSTYLLWIIFVVALGIRGKILYNEYITS